MKFYIFVLLITTSFVMSGLADPDKPVWPLQFTSPFGLNMPSSNIVNASSTLLYNWDVKSQMIWYHEKCVPFFGPDSSKYPCQMIFNKLGVFLLQPAVKGHSCCLAIPGVGSIPAEFLKPFNYSNTEPANDYFGKSHSCNHWVGIDGFAYWTDANSGDDIQFKDGDTGVFWNFGEFDLRPVPPVTFQLPSSSCYSLCILQSEEGQTHLKNMYNFFSARINDS